MSKSEEEFWKRCFRYARHKGSPRHDAEDFAQNAWIWKFGKRWKCTMEQLWALHYRETYRAKGTSSRRFYEKLYKRAIVSVISEEGFEESIYNFIGAEEKTSPDFSALSLIHQMLIVLLESGWSSQEIQEAFGMTSMRMMKLMRELRLALKLNQDDWNVAKDLMLTETEQTQIELKRLREEEKKLPPLGVKIVDEDLFS